MALDFSTAAPTIVALGSAVALALFNSWITSRAGIDQELRAKRLEVYPPLWLATSRVPRWPREEISREALEQLHRDLRTWYYSTGGMFLSKRARDRYGDVQKLIETLLKQDGEPTAILTEERYVDLMDAVSSLRTGLTEDLDTRRRTTLAERARRLWWHRKAGRKARRRRKKATDDRAAFRNIGTTRTVSSVRPSQSSSHGSLGHDSRP